jgi:hypothetical protein
LTGLKNLSFLIGPDMSNKGLAALTALKSLETLDIHSRRISLAGLNQLNELNHLTRLEATGIKQHDAVLDLSGLTRLEELRLSDVRDKDLAWMAKLEHLQRLEIGGPGVTDAGLKHLAAIDSLEHVRFGCYAGVTEEGMAWLAEHCPGLEIFKTPVSPP